MDTPSKETLERLYLVEQLSLGGIARLYDVHKTQVRRWLVRAGVPTRSVSEGTSLAAKSKPITEAQIAARRANAAKARAAVTAESFKKISAAKKGKPPSNKGKPMSEAQRQLLIEQRADPEYRRRASERLLGEKSPWWKGGKKGEIDRRLDRADWRRRRKECYERDNWTCQDCGKRCLNSRDARAHPKLKIQAHHVVSRRNGGPDDLDNLVTLCMSCHQRRERAERE